MAGVIGVATTAEIATGTAAKTILQVVAASNHPIKIRSWGIFFDGTSVSAEPIQVRLLRQTTAGTMSANTPKERTITGTTLQTTAQDAASAEPTAGDVLDVLEVHPQAGFKEKFSIGDEIMVAGGGRVGIETTAPASVNARAMIEFEE